LKREGGRERSDQSQSPSLLRQRLMNKKTRISREDYLIARRFIYSDIQRELNLAKCSTTEEGKNSLNKLIGLDGGGNFIAALALLCYTEFAGRLMVGGNKAERNFNAFFPKLGPEYAAFQKKCNVYDIFRCGMAHEYFIKHTYSKVAMLKKDATCGVGIGRDVKYYFCVEIYFEDFKKAFDALDSQLFDTEARESSAPRLGTTLSVQKY
jgi:hypothetical protein